MTSFFWQGFLHPLLVPSHFIVLIALGLLTGQQGGRALKLALPAFALLVMDGLVLTRFYVPGWNNELVLLILAALLGVLCALQLRLSILLVLLAAAVAGLVIGLDSGVTLIPGMKPAKTYLALAGTGVGAILTLTVCTLLGFYLHKLWQGIGVRVLGAWVTAGSVMVLALLLSGKL